MFIIQSKNLILNSPASARQIFSSFSNGINFFRDEVLSMSRRKAILKTGLFIFAVAAVYYVLLSGAIVGNNLKKVALTRELSTESRALDAVRSELIAGNSALTIDYLGTLGYKETKNLNVLKRTNNVAGNRIKSYQ